MNTKVINLFAGSGAGKSTTAALLFGEMKLRGYNVELVREYAKTWAWLGREISDMDQLYMLGKQINYEKNLYGKVDYIVTDSPVLLSGFYEEYHSDGQQNYTGQAALSFLDLAKEKGVDHKNFFIQRCKPFDPRGRYETAEEAKAIDGYMKDYLTKLNIPYNMIEVDDRERAGYILSTLGL